jgi:hypothetical protein
LAHIRYTISPTPEGWLVTCNDEAGEAYRALNEAVRDTLFAAKQLIDKGERVEVRLLEIDGPHKVWRNLQPQDAQLFR